MNGLRPYQQELSQQAEATLAAPGSRVMLQLPTGGGKTHIAGGLLRRWLHRGHKAVWLTHRTELADQTCEMLVSAGVSAIGPRCPFGSQRYGNFDGPDRRQAHQPDGDLGQI